MPRIWADTIDDHRRQVTDAILDATAELIAERGPLSVAMATIAERAGIGRATLYKYFPDLQAILSAWGARDFRERLHRLQTLGEDETISLGDVVEYVCAQPHHHDASAVSALAHRVAVSRQHAEGAIEPVVVGVLTDLLARLARRGQVRTDLEPPELARWLFHSAHAPAEIDRADLVRLVTDSLAPSPATARR